MDYGILAVAFVILGLAFLLLEKDAWLWNSYIPGFGILLFLAMLLFASIFANTSQNQSGIGYAAIVSNTVYANNGIAQEDIYGMTQQGVQAWIGKTSQPQYEVINFTVSTGSNFAQGNETFTLIVPQGYFYKISYVTGNFVYLNQS